MKIAIETVGCKLNQFESQALAESLSQAGFEIVTDATSADTVVVNTCSVTNMADVKSRQIIRKARRAGKMVVATGCYATTDAAALENPDLADIVIKNNAKFKLPEILKSRERVSSLRHDSLEEEFPVVHQFERTRATVKIQDGCNQFCSYCKIPHARGRSRSLPAGNVLQAVRTLLEENYREIVLTGINISDYKTETHTLSRLVKDILELPYDFRLRLSSLQPDLFESELLDCLSHPKFAPHFHLSLQSGSKTVLERMNRHYTPEEFIAIASQIRERRPDAGISTDIIVGFPGETDAEFEETLELTRRVQFTRVHAFTYSRRSHTRASRLPDMNGGIKKERLEWLEKTVNDGALEFIRAHVIGKEAVILTETAEKGETRGYTGQYFPARLKGEFEPNRFIRGKAGEAVMIDQIPGVILEAENAARNS